MEPRRPCLRPVGVVEPPIEGGCAATRDPRLRVQKPGLQLGSESYQHPKRLISSGCLSLRAAPLLRRELLHPPNPPNSRYQLARSQTPSGRRRRRRVGARAASNQGCCFLRQSRCRLGSGTSRRECVCVAPVQDRVAATMDLREGQA